MIKGEIMPENTQNDGIHHKRIFVVLSLARQIDGEFVLNRVESAFKEPKEAEDFAKQLNDKFCPLGKFNPQKLKTEHGDIDCYIIAAAHETELNGN